MDKKQDNKDNITVISLLAILLIIPFISLLFPKNTSVDTKKTTNDNYLIFINDTSKYDYFSDYLIKEKVPFKIIDANNKNEYNEIINKYNIDKKIFKSPALIYINDGRMFANIINIKSTKEIDRFLVAYEFKKAE